MVLINKEVPPSLIVSEFVTTHSHVNVLFMSLTMLPFFVEP